MKIYQEISLTSFEFWSGGADTAKHLTADELESIESGMEDLFPDGISATELNDIFCHESDKIADWLGYSSFEEIMEREEIDE